MTITTDVVPKRVYWEEPRFLDNVDGENVRRTPNIFNGDPLDKGTYDVLYTAFDQALNKAVCQFKVQVSGRSRK